MRHRAMRVPVWDVPVFFQGHRGTIVNMSKSGALIALNGRLPAAGKEGILTFELQDRTEALTCQVVRHGFEAACRAGAPPQWQMAVSFTDDPVTIGRVLRLAMATQRGHRAS